LRELAPTGCHPAVAGGHIVLGTFPVGRLPGLATALDAEKTIQICADIYSEDAVAWGFCRRASAK
jgi:hypothetical protein